MAQRIEISHKTIVFTVFFLLALWLVFLLREIILSLFVAFIIASALRPAVERLEKYLPRILAIGGLYIGVIGGMVFLGGVVIPPLIKETIGFVRQLPVYSQEISMLLQLKPEFLTGQIGEVGPDVLKLTLGVFSNFILVLTLLVVSFYWLLERGKLGEYLKVFLGRDFGERVYKVVVKTEEGVGAWVRGELILMTTIGVLTLVGLSVLRVPYALALAVVAGVLEIVPVVGPIISAIPAILIALTVSPLLALPVGALYFVIQLLENNLVVPVVMRRAVGVKPLLTVVALMVGWKLAGVGGALLSVPAVVVLEIVLREIWSVKEK